MNLIMIRGLTHGAARAIRDRADARDRRALELLTERELADIGLVQNDDRSGASERPAA